MTGNGLRFALVLTPCAVVAALAAPLVVHGLPDYESHLGEEYQPLKTFKFLSSHGREFHKWGPADNFLYAPGYALSLLYWKRKGTFGPAISSFPYGFHRPLEQLGALILQSRILLLCFVLFAIASLSLALVRAGFSRAAAFFAVFLGAATNPVLIQHAVLLKGDGPMIAFGCLGLGAYVLIVCDGIGLARAFWLSTFIAWAVSSKEAALPLFLLPCLRLAWEAFRPSQPLELRAQWRTALVLGVVSFAGWYALLNVVYAPATWLKRIRFVLQAGTDPEIWGAPGRSIADYAIEIVQSLANNLGPGGMVVALGSAAVALWIRPARCAALALPFLSYLLIGMLPVGYFPNRFALPAAIGLVPLVACCLDALGQRSRHWERSLWVAGAALGAANLIYANIAWLQVRSRPDDLIESYVLAHLPKDERFSVFSLWPRIPQKSRLAVLGYHPDPRPAARLIRTRQQLPKTVFVDSDLQLWIEDLARAPKRAEAIAAETGFEAADWKSFQALGYRLSDKLSSPLPAWYPFRWMPLAADADARTVLVYRLD
jgi:hypothetical protein